MRAARAAFPDLSESQIIGGIVSNGLRSGRVRVAVGYAYVTKVEREREVSGKRKARACVNCGATDFTLATGGAKERRCRDPRVCARRLSGKPMIVEAFR